MAFTLRNIRSFQIDHNSTCNLRCPQCARSHNGALNPVLPIKQLPVEFYKKVFTPEFCAQLESVLFCGNYGDVIASTNIHDVVAYLREAGLARINIFTNGSLRDAKWFEEMAYLLRDSRGKVVFSVDGLADTNHLYRVGSDFGKIMENAQAFINAGGRARWDYLVFEHNEHQVEEAMALAKAMGFESFKVKKTNRFVQNKNYQAGEASKTDNVFLPRQKSEQPAYKIAVPKQEKYQADGVNSFEQIVKRHKSWEGYINKTPIDCKALKERTMFIDFEGKLWPCTWLAAPEHFYGDDNIQKRQILQLIQRYGFTFNSLVENTFEEVMNHEWFNGGLADSWGSSMDSGGNFKLMTCGRTCGNEYEFSSNSYPNRELVSLNT
jgi:sulfatase maturation enzyme AslB (radical SAM superfamily)